MNTAINFSLNAERRSMRKKFGIVVTVCAAIAGVLLWLSFSDKSRFFKTLESETNESAVAKPQIKTKSPVPQSVQPTSGTNSIRAGNDGGSRPTTYMPGVQRPFKSADGQLVKNGQAGKWWLYARSPEEAIWMDHFGYPTPAEDMKLATLSDDELEQMGRDGDLNAKTQYGVRQALKAIKNGDERGVKIYAGFVVSTARISGPYAATEGLVLYSAFQREMDQIPPASRTQAQKNMAIEFAKLYASASEISALYSDYAAIKLRGASIIGSPSGDVSVALGYGENVAESIAGISANRIKEGLGPLIILPRPNNKAITSIGIGPFDPNAGSVLERY
jgi:hypothetical protein